MSIAIYISISKAIITKYTTEIIDSLRLISPICKDQLSTWHTLFLGYVGIVSLASAVIIIIMEFSSSSGSNYSNEASVLSYPRKIRNIVNYTLSSIAIMIILLLINTSLELSILFIYITAILMVPTFYMLYKYLHEIFAAKTDSDLFKEVAKRRLISILKKDLIVSASQEEAGDSSYSKEILYVSSIIEDDISHKHFKHAREALSWFTSIVVDVIPNNLDGTEIRKLSSTIITLRDSFANLIIEASASRNRGLLNSVLIQTELSSQHFIKAGLSSSFHSLLDSYQLAMKEQSDSAIIEQYASCFAAFGNLMAAISVLEDNSEKLKFKLAVLNTTLVLICYSFPFPKLGGSVIGLLQTLLRLDEYLTCSDSDDDKDYTGLGCWIFVNAILLRIVLSAPKSELRNQASALYANMHHEANEVKFPFQYIPEAANDLNKHWDRIRKSSTGDSLNFCLRQYFPGFIESMIQRYIIEAVFLISLTRLHGNSCDRYHVVYKLIDMSEGYSHPKGFFKTVTKMAKDAKLIADFDKDVLRMVEKYIRKRKQE